MMSLCNITEGEAESILDGIAKMYSQDSVFTFNNILLNDDLDLVKKLSIVNDNGENCVWVDIAYVVNKSYIFSSKAQAIAIGKPHTHKHALKTILWCLERRDVGFWYRFGNITKWIPLFKKGTTLDEVRVQLDLRSQ